MANKDPVLNGDSLADECMAGDLAICANLDAFLYFDEGSYLRVIPDLAPVEVYEGVQFYALPQFQNSDNERKLVFVAYLKTHLGEAEIEINGGLAVKKAT